MTSVQTFTVEDVKRGLFGTEEEPGPFDDGDWGEVRYDCEGDEGTYVPGLGTVKTIAEYGGEGQGDEYWFVLKVGGQYFRMDGWYNSYSGGEYDSELREVTPKQKMVTYYGDL